MRRQIQGAMTLLALQQSSPIFSSSLRFLRMACKANPIEIAKLNYGWCDFSYISIGRGHPDPSRMTEVEKFQIEKLSMLG
ncbi:hypothetical protein [Rhizobium sp. RAF56]|jgi:hypothetical protein|uniref:hypothetical protein n=1 Tax=Rhizobium sp. RAF56 TaxID=3233062 RepID=UPI003F9D2403